jgi:plasmid maintenance system killer protein
MDVFFTSERLAGLLGSERALRKEFGPENAKWILRRLDNLRFAGNLAELATLPGNLHELTGDRRGTLAINLKHGYRLLIQPADEPPPRKPDGGLDWQAVRSVVVVGVEDYHD